MDTPLNNRLEDVFAGAAELPTGDRAAFLDVECAGQPELRAEVEELLRSHEAIGIMPNPGMSDEIDMQEQFARLKPEEPGDRIGNYKLLEQIGEGGFGVVWLAEQERPVRRQVALKILKLGMDTCEVIARFEQERQALALMDHANIAKVHDAGATRFGRPYFVMELVQGKPLTDYCDEAKLSTRERLEIFLQVCQGVQHAHQKGIIHRDLKPSNILVKQQDGKAIPKIIDFGIAKAIEQRLTELTIRTEVEQLIGTPVYMSPEQAGMSTANIDTRTDIYALGVVLYELLTGRTPFEREELVQAGFDEMRRIIREVEPPKPSTALRAMAEATLKKGTSLRHSEIGKLIHAVSGDLDWIVMKALEKDRACRYATANGLMVDVERHLRREPVSARPPNALYRFERLVRRHRLAFGATIAIAAALIAGTVVSAWQMIVAKRATRDALVAEGKAAAAARTETEASAKAVAQEKVATSLAYAANMNLVQRAWDRNETGFVRELLAQTKSYPSRGFEWFYWRALCHQELLTIRRHLSKITAFAISSDGRMLASADTEGVVNIHDLSSGRLIRSFHGAEVEIDRRSYPVLTKHIPELKIPDSVTVLAFSPNDQSIAFGRQSRAFLCNIASGEVRAFTDSHEWAPPLRSILFSPNGQRMATVSNWGANIWNVSDGTLLRTLKSDQNQPWWVALSDDHDEIVVPRLRESVDAIATIRRSASTGATLGRISDWVDQKVYRFERTSDNTRILFQGKNGIDVWNTNTGIRERTLEIGGINSFAVSRNGYRVAVACQDRTARVFEVSTGRESFTLKGHFDAVTCVAYSPDGSRIITGSSDQEIKVWDANGPEKVNILPAQKRQSITAFLRNEERILTATVGGINPDSSQYIDLGSVRIWDVVTGKESFNLQWRAAPNFPTTPVGYSQFRWVRSLMPRNAVAISPDGRLIAATSTTGITLWDATAGQELRLIDPTNTGFHGPIAFDPSSRWILTGGFDPKLDLAKSEPQEPLVRLWEVTTGRQLMEFRGHTDSISAVAFFHDGKRIVTASMDGTTRLWDQTNGRELMRLDRYENPVNAFAIPADDQWLVTASSDSTARVEDPSTGRTLQVLKGHTQDIRSVAVSSDASRIVTGSDDGTIKFWDPKNGRDLLTLEAGPGLSLSEDGRRLASSLANHPFGTKIWKSATPAQMDLWEREEEIEGKFKATKALLARDSMRSLQKLSSGSKDPQDYERASKLYCLVHFYDSVFMETALALAGNAVKLAEGREGKPWYQICLGIVEYRKGNFIPAERALIVEDEASNEILSTNQFHCIAEFFRSMSRAHQGDDSEARQLLAQAEARMNKLTIEKTASGDGDDSTEDLILWLARNEARSVLELKAMPKRNGK